eukprot:gene7405-8657_t
MSEELVTEIVQFIDHKGDIVKEENDQKKSFLSCLSERSDFLTKGFDYSVIAILGPQSSGKSTLLNILFNTKFAVMDSVTGRKQTTQGVWMGIANVDSPETYLILDVEGTDGRERGEDEKAFERKTSLFSLVLSSVLIINMWVHDIGRYNAANIGLLKTVFELNLQLFQKKRDHDGQTPMSQLTETLLQDINQVWSELSKPKEFINSKSTDFFDFEFTSLPHKIFCKDSFLEQANQLKNRFLNPSAEDFVPKKQYRNDIPSDGLYQFSNNVWETIKSNRDLDLPSQKEMLALFRCDEFVEASYNTFADDVKPVRERIEKGRIAEGFGETGRKLLAACLESYDIPAARYHPETVSKKRQVLADRAIGELKSLFSKQMEKLFEKSIEFYKNLVQETGTFKKDAAPSGSSSSSSGTSQQLIPHFAVWSKNVKESTIDYFEKIAKSSVVPGSDWDYQTDLQELEEKITAEIQTLKESQLNKLSKFMKDIVFQQISPQLVKITEQAGDDMWKKISNMFVDSLSKHEKDYRKRLTDFDTKENDIENILAAFRANSREQLRLKMKERAEFLPLRMRKRFEECFSLDDKKLPRKWSKSDDVGSIFKEARFNAEKLIDLFSYMRLDEEEWEFTFFTRDEEADTPSNSIPTDLDNVIIPYEQCVSLTDTFRLDVKSDFMNAMNEQNRSSSAAGVPGYIILLLCILGFNEFIAIITNPLLLILVILLGAGGFVLYKLNLTGPFIDIASSMLVNIINKIKDIVLHVENLSSTTDSTNDKKKKD